MNIFRRLLFVFNFAFVVYTAFAQAMGDIYRRNSLCVGIISNPEIKSSNETKLIYDAVKEYQLSDKYNDHNVGLSVIDLETIDVSRKDVNLYKKTEKRSFLQKMNSALNVIADSFEAENGIQTDGLYGLDPEEVTIIKLKKYIDSQNIPALLIAKWFNASNVLNDGTYYNMSLIQERGAYNASELDVLRAKESVRGMSILKDAGMELIPNTYVLLISLKMETATSVLTQETKKQESTNKEIDDYISKRGDKIVGRKTYKIDKTTGRRVAVYTTDTIKAEKRAVSQIIKSFSIDSEQIKKNYEEAKNTAGYYVKATAYLFKLKWEEDEESLFISTYYDQSPQALLSSHDFKLEFIDYRTDMTEVTEKKKNANYSDNLKLIKKATMQSIDKCIANLQKEHEDFKVKAPLIDVNMKDATAFIGYKEGISEDSKFEVLERVYNENKNTYRYKKVGTLKVDKKRIWDNRYNIEDGTGNERDAINSMIDRTYFNGSTKNLAPGMLIRQLK